MRGPVVGSKQVLKQTASCFVMRDEPASLPTPDPWRMTMGCPGFGLVVAIQCGQVGN